jgi:hypothetical protein
MVDQALFKLNNLIDNHNSSSSTDLRTLKSLKERTEKRKDEDQKNREREDRLWTNLDTQSDIVQLKYFLTRSGPIAGKKEFSDWKSDHNMVQGTGFVANKVKKDDEKMNAILEKALEYEKEPAPVVKKDVKKVETNDDKRKIKPVPPPKKTAEKPPKPVVEDDDDIFEQSLYG